MPISPSYRAKQAPRLKSVSTAGTYVPPKAPSTSPPLVPVKQDMIFSAGKRVIPYLGIILAINRMRHTIFSNTKFIIMLFVV